VTERRRPIHLAVMLGAATSAYAISVAGVTWLQSQADQNLIDRQAPAQEAAARLGNGHDRLAAEVERASQSYAGSVARYDELAASLASMEASLQKYAGRVEAVSGAARSLPARVTLPSISRTVTKTTSKPAVSASTGASGG
jgi:hypothetical protein